MFFCNMVGESGVRSFNRRGKVAFSNTFSKIAQDAVFSVVEDTVVVTAGGEGGSSLFMKGLEGGGPALYNEKLSKTLTKADVADTPDNPLLICLCKEITVYDGIPADIKIMGIDEDTALVMLITGKIEIDGSPLARCKDIPAIERPSKTFKARDFITFGNFVDEESGYNFYWDAIHHIRINYKNKSESIGYANIKEDKEFLTTKGLEEARKRAEEKKRIAEERRMKKIAEEAERKRKLEEKEKAEKARQEALEAEQRRASAKEFLKAMLG